MAPKQNQKTKLCQIRTPWWPQNWTIPANPSSRKCCTKKFRNVSWEIRWCLRVAGGLSWNCFCGRMWRYNIPCDVFCAFGDRAFRNPDAVYIAFVLPTFCQTELEAVCYMYFALFVWYTTYNVLCEPFFLIRHCFECSAAFVIFDARSYILCCPKYFHLHIQFSAYDVPS
jgi:hypothetical protein